MTALDDRRQAARETFYDRCDTGGMVNTAINEAIETATRVRITPEVVDAFYNTIDTTTGLPRRSTFVSSARFAIAKLRAAFRAAGFEVEE